MIRARTPFLILSNLETLASVEERWTGLPFRTAGGPGVADWDNLFVDDPKLALGPEKVEKYLGSSRLRVLGSLVRETPEGYTVYVGDSGLWRF